MDSNPTPTPTAYEPFCFTCRDTGFFPVGPGRGVQMICPACSPAVRFARDANDRARDALRLEREGLAQHAAKARECAQTLRRLSKAASR